MLQRSETRSRELYILPLISTVLRVVRTRQEIDAEVKSDRVQLLQNYVVAKGQISGFTRTALTLRLLRLERLERRERLDRET